MTSHYMKILQIHIYCIATYIHEAYHVAQFLVAEGMLNSKNV